MRNSVLGVALELEGEKPADSTSEDGSIAIKIHNKLSLLVIYYYSRIQTNSLTFQDQEHPQPGHRGTRKNEGRISAQYTQVHRLQ